MCDSRYNTDGQTFQNTQILCFLLSSPLQSPPAQPTNPTQDYRCVLDSRHKERRVIWWVWGCTPTNRGSSKGTLPLKQDDNDTTTDCMITCTRSTSGERHWVYTDVDSMHQTTTNIAEIIISFSWQQQQILVIECQCFGNECRRDMSSMQPNPTHGYIQDYIIAICMESGASQQIGDIWMEGLLSVLCPCINATKDQLGEHSSHRCMMITILWGRSLPCLDGFIHSFILGSV